MNILLEYAGFTYLFPHDKCVSTSNGYDQDSQQMLGMALQIERCSDHYIVFDTSPYANTAAQKVEMQCVLFIGAHKQ
jgi:hypothetical protein